jgi:hypothetical protein
VTPASCRGDTGSFPGQAMWVYCGQSSTGTSFSSSYSIFPRHYSLLWSVAEIAFEGVVLYEGVR